MSRGRLVFWGYTAQGLNMLAGILLMPAIVRYLSAPEVGLWFVFLTLSGLAQLLDLGFEPTIARNVAYVYAGAQSISAAGLPATTDIRTSADPQLLRNLITAARRVYLMVSGAVALVLLIGGTFYIRTLLTPDMAVSRILIAWLLFGTGFVVQFYYGYCLALLQGRGDVHRANQAIVATKSVLIVTGVIFLRLGCGLPGLGIASLLSCIAGRGIALWFLRAADSGAAYQPDLRETRALVRALWHNASRFGLVQVGAFLTLRGNLLVASSLLGLQVAGQYGITTTVLAALLGMSTVVLQVQLPRMSMLQAQGRRAEILSLYSEIIVLAWCLFAAGAICLMLFGNSLLLIAGAKLRLLPPGILALLAVATALEMNHTIAAAYLTTTNRVDFVASALVSGATIIVVSAAFASRFGVWSLAGSYAIVQLAYNNWKWPREALRHLGTSPRELVIRGSSQLRAAVTLPARHSEI